jgi:hypothetical protein
MVKIKAQNGNLDTGPSYRSRPVRCQVNPDTLGKVTMVDEIPLDEALQINPGCSLVLWQNIATEMCHRRWIAYVRRNGWNGCLRILQPGIEHLNNLAEV